MRRWLTYEGSLLVVLLVAAYQFNGWLPLTLIVFANVLGYAEGRAKS